MALKSFYGAPIFFGVSMAENQKYLSQMLLARVAAHTSCISHQHACEICDVVGTRIRGLPVNGATVRAMELLQIDLFLV